MTSLDGDRWWWGESDDLVLPWRRDPSLLSHLVSSASSHQIEELYRTLLRADDELVSLAAHLNARGSFTGEFFGLALVAVEPTLTGSLLLGGAQLAIELQVRGWHEVGMIREPAPPWYVDASIAVLCDRSNRDLTCHHRVYFEEAEATRAKEVAGTVETTLRHLVLAADALPHTYLTAVSSHEDLVGFDVI